MGPSRRDKDGRRAGPGPSPNDPLSPSPNDDKSIASDRKVDFGNSTQNDAASLHPVLVARQRRGQPYPSPSASPSPDEIRAPPRLFPTLSGLGGRITSGGRHAEHAVQTALVPRLSTSTSTGSASSAVAPPAFASARSSIAALVHAHAHAHRGGVGQKDASLHATHGHYLPWPQRYPSAGPESPTSGSHRMQSANIPYPSPSASHYTSAGSPTSQAHELPYIGSGQNGQGGRLWPPANIQQNLQGGQNQIFVRSDPRDFAGPGSQQFTIRTQVYNENLESSAGTFPPRIRMSFGNNELPMTAIPGQDDELVFTGSVPSGYPTGTRLPITIQADYDDGQTRQVLDQFQIGQWIYTEEGITYNDNNRGGSSDVFHQLPQQQPMQPVQHHHQPQHTVPSQNNFSRDHYKQAVSTYSAPQPSLLRQTQIANQSHLTPYNQQQLKAKLELAADLDLIAKGWTPEEWTARRRLVQFWRRQEGTTIHVAFCPLKAEDYQAQSQSIVISCIFREDHNQCYVTSVDAIYLLEALIGNRFSVEEKNRIRRNLERCKPKTISKSSSDSDAFFKLIMGFPNPKPRNIEKDVKVFPWEELKDGLRTIIRKYASAANTLVEQSAGVAPYRPVHPGHMPYQSSSHHMMPYGQQQQQPQHHQMSMPGPHPLQQVGEPFNSFESTSTLSSGSMPHLASHSSSESPFNSGFSNINQPITPTSATSQYRSPEKYDYAGSPTQANFGVSNGHYQWPPAQPQASYNPFSNDVFGQDAQLTLPHVHESSRQANPNDLRVHYNQMPPGSQQPPQQ